jgi:hypothetical protein
LAKIKYLHPIDFTLASFGGCFISDGDRTEGLNEIWKAT